MFMVPLICALITGSVFQTAGQKPVEYAFKQLEQGGFSRQREPKLFVIKSPDEFQAYNKATGREEATPTLDWGKNQIIAIHIGATPTTGYGAVVKRIVKTGPHSVEIDVLKTTPPPRGMVAMHVTYPFVLVTTPRFVETATVKMLPLGPAAPRGLSSEAQG